MKKKLFTVFLDAGHGGVVGGRYVTPGKRSPVLETGCGMYEGVFTRWVCGKVAALENTPGIEIIYDDYDYDKSIGDRVHRINALYRQPDLVVSVHANAFGGGGWEDSVYGPRVLVAQSKPRNAYKAAVATLEVFAGYSTSISYPVPRTSPRKLGILESTKPPAILVECGFMTSKDDCHRMIFSPSLYLESLLLLIRLLGEEKARRPK